MRMDDRESRAQHVKDKTPEGKGRGKKNGGKQQGDIGKYNGYVDAVFKRMNSLIRAKRMDPLRVNLFAGKPQNSSSSSNNEQKQKPEGGVKNKNKSAGHGGQHGSTFSGAKGGHRNQNKKNNNNNNKESKGKKKKNQNQRRGPKTDDYDDEDAVKAHSRHVRSESSTHHSVMMTDKMRPISMEVQANRSSSSSTTTTTKGVETTSPATSSSSSSESKEMKGGTQNNDNPNRPTRGVLHGLSTLRRAGSVKVLRRGPDVRLVRAKFLLGPVALDILPKKSSNGTKSSNTPTATATARSLNGVLEIRLKNAAPTRIRKLRVFPPANVRVEGENKGGMKKQGYRKVTPVASRRLMSVANQVVRQTERLRNKPKNNNHNNRRRTGGGNSRQPGNNKNKRVQNKSKYEEDDEE